MSADTCSALADLGAGPGTLTAAERAALDRDGYVIFHDLIGAPQLDMLRNRFDQLLASEDGRGREVHAEANVGRLANLVNKGTEWEICLSHPKVLAAIWHVIGGELHLSSLNGRSALPGYGNQALHCDIYDDRQERGHQACNSLWMLDDFTPENGPTRIVPGTHRLATMPRDLIDDPSAPHPDQVLALGRAGTVLVFNALVWHGGTTNRTAHERRAVHSFWADRSLRQPTDQRHWLSAETVEQLSPTLRFLVDV